MFLRPLAICSYLVVAYWISHHIPQMKMVFYPTLGAFSFLFMKRGGQLNHIGRMIIGACVSSMIGSAFYMVQSGTVSFFITALATVTLIHVCKWDAAPIMAVSLIPYFAHPASFWMLPLSVFISLLGLVLPLWLLERIESMGWHAALDNVLLKLLRQKDPGGASISPTQQ